METMGAAIATVIGQCAGMLAGIGRTRLGLEATPEICYADAKESEQLELDSRMIDLVMRDGKLDRE